LGTTEADDLLADLAPEERASSWHLILDPEAPAAPRSLAGQSGPTRLSAGAALAPALSLLRGGRIPAALLSRMPRVTERGYRWVADHRGLLGRFVPARARRWADRVIATHGGPARLQ
jgi:predicted DCC family thiol-disulfide oxidoreductase YuxK